MDFINKKSCFTFCCSLVRLEAEDMKRFRDDVLIDHAGQMKGLREELNQQTVKTERYFAQRT